MSAYRALCLYWRTRSSVSYKNWALLLKKNLNLETFSVIKRISFALERHLQTFAKIAQIESRILFNSHGPVVLFLLLLVLQIVAGFNIKVHGRTGGLVSTRLCSACNSSSSGFWDVSGVSFISTRLAFSFISLPISTCSKWIRQTARYRHPLSLCSRPKIFGSLVSPNVIRSNLMTTVNSSWGVARSCHSVNVGMNGYKVVMSQNSFDHRVLNSAIDCSKSDMRSGAFPMRWNVISPANEGCNISISRQTYQVHYLGVQGRFKELCIRFFDKLLTDFWFFESHFRLALRQSQKPLNSRRWPFCFLVFQK